MISATLIGQKKWRNNDNWHINKRILDQLKETKLERVQTDRTILMERRTLHVYQIQPVVPIIHLKEGFSKSTYQTNESVQLIEK